MHFLTHKTERCNVAKTMRQIIKSRFCGNTLWFCSALAMAYVQIF